MKDLYTWEINNQKFEFDIEDAETAEKYENSLQILSEADKLKSSDKKYSEIICEYCKVFRKFYNSLLGEGSAEKIFKDIKDNIRKYDAVYEAFLDFIRTQRIESDNRVSRMVARYVPKKAKK